MGRTCLVAFIAALLVACASSGSEERVETPLHVALNRGDMGQALALLDAGASPNARGHNGQTPIFRVDAREPQAEAVLERLLELGADVDAVSDRGWTPAMYAARWDRVETVRWLAEHGADVSRRHPLTDSTLLHTAARKGCERLDELLALDLGLDVDAGDEHGSTPLIQAALQGYVEPVRALIGAGADPNLASNNGLLPLRAAIGEEDSVEIFRILLEAGADPNAVHRMDDYRPLHSAVLADGNKVELVRLLLESGADPNVPDPKGRLPLHGAARAESAEMARALVASGARVVAVEPDGKTAFELLPMGADPALRVVLGGTGQSHSGWIGGRRPGTLFDPDVTRYPERIAQQKNLRLELNAKDEYCGCPLSLAAGYGDVQSVTALIAAGARLGTFYSPRRGEPDVEWGGWRPLHFAAVHAEELGSADVIDVLVEAGADLEDPDWASRTPLFLAVEYGRPEAVRRFAAAGADLEERAFKGPYRGLSPLQVAARTNLREIVELLIGAGADLGRRDKKGRTALHEAAEVGAVAAVEALIAAGADPMIEDREGVTPRDLVTGASGSTQLRSLLGAR